MNHNNNALQLQQQILSLVCEKLNTDQLKITAESNLIEAGLNSITLMTLVSHWRAAGYKVSFATLAQDPRAVVWAEYLQQVYTGTEKGSNQGISSLSHIGKHPNAPFPLAPMQYAYWVGRDDNQPLGGVSAHLYTEFQLSSAQGSSNYLDPKRLSLAMTKLCQRHGCLRLQVHSDGQQTQTPADNIDIQVTLNDLRHKSDADVAQILEEYRQHYSAQMLDIEAGQVFAIALSLLPDGSCRLHLDVDMIAADAVSYRTLLKELAQLYEDPDQTLPELLLSYKDCRQAIERDWQNVQENSGKWWQQRIADLPDGPMLPLNQDLPEKPVTTRRHLHFDAELKNALYAQCRQFAVTPSVALASLLAETLAGWSQDPRFLLNVPLFQRPLDGADVSAVVGDFSSSILLDVDTGTKQNFAQRARQVQLRMHEDAAHADYAGVHVLRDLGRARGHQVTAPVVFTSALDLGELFDSHVRRVFGDPIWIISQGPQVLLDAQVTELDGGILINWDCREDAFMDGVLDAMFTFFHRTLLALADNSETWTTNLADTLPSERIRPHWKTFDNKEKHIAIAPRTAMERTVSAIWSEVIGGDGQDIQQNLFAAGGDSVLATALIAQLREVFGPDTINMKTLFSSPTIAGIADSISSSDIEGDKAQIAEVYCEILDLDDEALNAELEAEND